MRGRGRSLGGLVACLALLGSLLAAGDASAFIYWADPQNHQIGRAENDGSGVDPSFIEVGEEPAGVAVDSAHIYWSNRLAGSIGRANLDGSGVNNAFIVGLDEPRGLAVNGSSIFWADFTGGSVGKANLDGSSPKPSFIADPSSPCDVALDSGHVYWTDTATGTPAYVGRAGLDGLAKQPTYVTIELGIPCGVAVNSANIFWSDFGFPAFGTRIGRANLNEPKSKDETFIGEASTPCGLTLNGSQLYWANAGTGTIGRANSDGTGVNQSFVATGGGQICGVAVDSLASPPPQQPPAPTPDTTKPKIEALKGPGKGLAKGKARFSFRSNEAGSTFACKLDRARPTRCKSPKSYAHLKPGAHAFKVWATDPAGNKSAAPATRRFRVPAR